jgi:hypothetical protein
MLHPHLANQSTPDALQTKNISCTLLHFGWNSNISVRRPATFVLCDFHVVVTTSRPQEDQCGLWAVGRSAAPLGCCRFEASHVITPYGRSTWRRSKLQVSRSRAWGCCDQRCEGMGLVNVLPDYNQEYDAEDAAQMHVSLTLVATKWKL